MISSIFQGVAGLVVEPIKGAKSNGVKGASLGVGKGILGLIWKPIAGSIDFVTQTARGIGNTPGTIYVGAKKIFKRKMKRIKISYEYPAIRPYIPDENIEEEKDIYIGEDEEGEIYLNKSQLKLILQQHGIIDQESIDLISNKNELNINQQLMRQREKLMKKNNKKWKILMRLTMNLNYFNIILKIVSSKRIIKIMKKKTKVSSQNQVIEMNLKTLVSYLNSID